MFSGGRQDMIPGISGNVTVLLLLLENLIITQIIKREDWSRLFPSQNQCTRMSQSETIQRIQSTFVSKGRIGLDRYLTDAELSRCSTWKHIPCIHRQLHGMKTQPASTFLCCCC